MFIPTCKQCGHREDEHDGANDCIARLSVAEGKWVACGCVKFQARVKREPTRQWVIVVSFMLKNGWTRPYEAKVRAFGLVGAVSKGIREAKCASVRPRARIKNTKVTMVTAVPQPRTPKPLTGAKKASVDAILDLLGM
jgi:hypothetical protein